MNIQSKIGLTHPLSALALATLLSWQINMIAAPEIPAFTICTDNCVIESSKTVITYDCSKQPDRYSGCLNAVQTSGPAGFATHAITFSTKGKNGVILHQFKCSSATKWNEYNNDHGLDYYWCG